MEILFTDSDEYGLKSMNSIQFSVWSPVPKFDATKLLHHAFFFNLFSNLLVFLLHWLFDWTRRTAAHKLKWQMNENCLQMSLHCCHQMSVYFMFWLVFFLLFPNCFFRVCLRCEVSTGAWCQNTEWNCAAVWWPCGCEEKNLLRLIFLSQFFHQSPMKLGMRVLFSFRCTRRRMDVRSAVVL